MKIGLQQVGDALVVFIKGELDHHAASLVRNEIERELDKGSVNKIVLECSELEFMDSSGLGVILGRYKRVRTEGGNMVACCLNEQVNRIFHLSGLRQVINTYDTLDSALDNI